MNSVLTYGDFERGLTHLGFTVELGPNYKVYRNIPYDAMILVPKRADDEPLQAAHFVAARHHVVANGIADEETFEKALSSGATAIRKSVVYNLSPKPAKRVASAKPHTSRASTAGH